MPYFIRPCLIFIKKPTKKYISYVNFQNNGDIKNTYKSKKIIFNFNFKLYKKQTILW